MKMKFRRISDIERARRNPSDYGCHGTAVEGELRPTRPRRESLASILPPAVSPAAAPVPVRTNGTKEVEEAAKKKGGKREGE